MQNFQKIGILVTVIAISITIIIVSIFGNPIFLQQSSIADAKNKPDLGIITESHIVAVFDELYSKYPNITQKDVNKAHSQASIYCASESGKLTENRSFLSDAIQTSMCDSIISGMLQKYLDDLGISYYTVTDNSIAPKLVD